MWIFATEIKNSVPIRIKKTRVAIWSMWLHGLYENYDHTKNENRVNISNVNFSSVSIWI